MAGRDNVNPDATQGDAPKGLLESLINKYLETHKSDTSGSLIHRLTAGEQQRLHSLLRPIVIAIGDAPLPDLPDAPVELLFRWAMGQLRPDRRAELLITDREAWLERTSWRPVIALLCHYGFTQVPDFPDRYYRARGEQPVDNLCGLWGIGPSTFYRCIDTAKRRLAQLLDEQLRDRRHHDALRTFTAQAIYRHNNLVNSELQQAWHRAQAARWVDLDDYIAALWHLRMACEFEQAGKLIERHLVLIATESELDEEVQILQREVISDTAPVRIKTQLLLTVAALHRVRNQPEMEHATYERALRIAANPEDPASLGMIYSRLGRYYEPRDADRAFACYQESVDYFARTEHALGDVEIHAEYSATLVQLAWFYTLRNDPRARPLLEKAHGLLPQTATSAPTRALLEQAWGEYWRRSGEYEQALEHKHRALSMYERLGDEQGMLKTFINLGVIYDDMKRYDKAMDYYMRVLAMAERTVVDPEHIASTRLNLGACHYWQKDYGAAIHEYHLALETSTAAGLKLHMGRAHYNLAEAYYTRYLESKDPQDESMGDFHVTAAIDVWKSEDYPVYVESAQSLKRELLGGTKAHDEHRILPQEKAAHYAEMVEIEQQRAVLDSTAAPEAQIAAHLTIARVYMSISMKEREQAQQLIERYNLADQFAEGLQTIERMLTQSLTDEDRLVKRWREATQMAETDVRPVLRRLLRDGFITKSAYAETRGVSPATASKHLVQLAQNGLLKQQGRGAGTRYILVK